MFFSYIFQFFQTFFSFSKIGPINNAHTQEPKTESTDEDLIGDLKQTENLDIKLFAECAGGCTKDEKEKYKYTVNGEEKYYFPDDKKGALHYWNQYKTN